MDRKLFNNIVESRISDIKSKLASKGAEYSKEDNVFSNFESAARMLGTNRFQALRGMLVKHLVSVDDIINRIDNEIPADTMIQEKIGDIINYYILLEAMLYDEINKNLDKPF